MGIIQSALSNVLSIQANPSQALQGAVNAFTASANIASRIEDKLNKKAEQVMAIRQQALNSEFKIKSQLANMDFQAQQGELSRASALERTKLNLASREKINEANNNRAIEVANITSNARKYGKSSKYNSTLAYIMGNGSTKSNLAQDFTTNPYNLVQGLNSN